jgi:hypothetical protein
MGEIQTTKERILIFLDLKGIKREVFYRETGISASTFKGIGLKSELGVDKLLKVLIAYPELNNYVLWLIKGEGNIEELIAARTESQGTKKGKPVKDFPEVNNSEEKILHLLANIFAQSNIQDKGLMFMQKQIKRIEEKQDKILEVLNQKKAKNNN